MHGTNAVRGTGGAAADSNGISAQQHNGYGGSALSLSIAESNRMKPQDHQDLQQLQPYQQQRQQQQQQQQQHQKATSASLHTTCFRVNTALTNGEQSRALTTLGPSSFGNTNDCLPNNSAAFIGCLPLTPASNSVGVLPTHSISNGIDTAAKIGEAGEDLDTGTGRKG